MPLVNRNRFHHSREEEVDTLGGYLEKLTLTQVAKQVPPAPDNSHVRVKGLALYVLRLRRGKIYAGVTRNLQQRLEAHFSGRGSEWTKLYPPVEILAIYKDVAPIWEKEITLDYMRHYGWQNVRGYSWSQINMKNPPVALR